MPRPETRAREGSRPREASGPRGGRSKKLGLWEWKALAAAERPPQLAISKELFHHAPFGQRKLLFRVLFAHRRSLVIEDWSRPGGTESEI